MTYDNYERAQGWDEQAFGSSSSLQDAQFEAELSGLPLDLSKPLRVLDIGFGNGAFMGWARRRGLDCEGVEINPRLVQRATTHAFVARTNIKDLQDSVGWQPYGLITAFDVLEHIERDALVPFLSSLHEVCRQDTLLVFRFPNGDNPFSLPIQNGDVTHRTAIGQSLMRQVAELSELDVVSLRSPRQPLKGASLPRKVAVAIGIPARWLLGEAIRHLFMGGMRVVFSGNLLAILKTRKN